jgi:hypothetical protein
VGARPLRNFTPVLSTRLAAHRPTA